MSCFHPLVGYRQKGSSDKLIIVRAKEDVKDFVFPPKDFQVRHRYETLTVPCGKCIGCRLDYSRTWANRMMLELPYHDSAYFVTLTYDDDYVPVHEYLSNEVDPDTGEVIGEPVFEPSLSLEPDHVQKFMKRLRRQQDYYYGNQDISFYFVGEYGSSTCRPHYHAIIYGLRLDDLQVFRVSDGNTTYRSSTLEKLWSFGFSSVGSVTWETCAYCARYMLKKQKGNTAAIYDYFNVYPEFSRCSLKPAIGKRWYDEHKDECYEYDEIILSTAKRSVKAKPPAYFDAMYDLEFPERMKEIKANRRMVASLHELAEMEQFSGTYLELLAVKELTLKDRASRLKREL